VVTELRNLLDLRAPSVEIAFFLTRLLTSTLIPVSFTFDENIRDWRSSPASGTGKTMDRWGSTGANYDRKIFEAWGQTVNNDLVLIVVTQLGDASAPSSARPRAHRTNAGQKLLLKGNHDYCGNRDRR
jgi:hypothetical protein